MPVIHGFDPDTKRHYFQNKGANSKGNPHRYYFDPDSSRSTAIQYGKAIKQQKAIFASRNNGN